MMIANVIEGGCLCGAVRYRVTGKAIDQLICHCQTCRHAHGSPSVAWITCRSTDLVFMTGKPTGFRSSPEVVRTFCNKCGTPLTYQHESDLDVIDVATATVDFPNEFAPSREVWVEQKLVWESLDSTLPHYPRSTAQGLNITNNS